MAVATIERDVILSILGKLKVDYAENIPAKRAQKKLERVLAKEDYSGVKFSKNELAALEALGGKPGKSKKGSTKGAAEETPKTKKGKKKSSKAASTKGPAGTKQWFRDLLAKGKTKDEIKPLFMERYKGVGDAEFVERRFKVYCRRCGAGGKGGNVKKAKKGTKKAAAKAAKAEAAKASKKGTKAKKAEKPAKKAKKKAKASDDEEE